MIYLISLILFLLPTYLIRFSIFNIPTTLLEVLIYLILIVGIVIAKREGFRKIPLKIWIPISILVLGLIISVIISPDKRTALGELKGFFIDPLIVFWLIWQFVKKNDLSKIFFALSLSGLMVAVHTIVLKILGNTAFDGRVIGVFGYSPNYTALFLAPISVAVFGYIFWFQAKKSYLYATASILLLVIYILAIYFSGSRGGFLAVATGLTVFLIAYYWSWIRTRISAKVIIAILILGAIYTSWTFLKPDFSVSPEVGRMASSNNIRWLIWDAALELGAKHPILGIGLGNFQNAFNELTKERANFPEYITPMALTPHNLYLMFWLSVGILGIIGFIWVIIAFLKQVFKKFKSKEAVILIAIMATILSYGLIEASIWKNDLSIIFWTVWGLAWIL